MGPPGLSASSRTDIATHTRRLGAGHPAGPEAHPAERTVLVAVALGTMLAPLNSTMIVVALPAILDDFNRSLAWGSWIVVSYLVAMAAIQPLGGSLGDRYGRRRMFIGGLAGFLLASLGAALAPTIEALIVARTVQALAGATAIPNGVALVRASLPADRQGRAFGTIGSGIAIAAAVGPPLGGIVSETFGWRWIFAANILLVVPALALALRLVADRPERRGASTWPVRCLLLVGLVSLAFSLTIWRLDGVPWVVAPLLGLLAGVALLLLVRRARRIAAPALNPELFRRPGYTPATLTVLFSNLAMYTVLLSLPIYLDKRAGWSGEEIGLLLPASRSRW